MIVAHPVAAVRAAESALLRAECPPEGPAGGTASRLMEQAAAGLAAVVLRELRQRRGRVAGSRVALLVGSGDNGGDALLAGARLAQRGVAVTAVLVADRAHREGLDRLRRAGGRVANLTVPDADLIVDGILGIGASGGLREPAASVVRSLLDAADRPPVVAVDLPSGIGPDDGSAPGPVLPADVTVTFGAVKPGLLLPPAADVAGRIELVDIGLDIGTEPAVWRLEADDVADLWPLPGQSSHKYTRGVLGVIAGSEPFSGAAVLGVDAASRAGAGMIRFTGSDAAHGLVRAAVPEAVHSAGRVQAWVLGSGVSPDDDGLVKQIREAMAGEQPCVVDAGALSLVTAADPGEDRRWLLTPHAGEAAELVTRLGRERTREQVEAAPAQAVRELAHLCGCAVLLKGSTTLVAAPDGTLFAQHDGTPRLATAGSGDVLAGIAGALLSGLEAVEPVSAAGLALAGAAAVWVHGQAGQHASGNGEIGHPIRARDITAALPVVLAR